MMKICIGSRVLAMCIPFDNLNLDALYDSFGLRVTVGLGLLGSPRTSTSALTSRGACTRLRAGDWHIHQLWDIKLCQRGDIRGIF